MSLRLDPIKDKALIEKLVPGGVEKYSHRPKYLDRKPEAPPLLGKPANQVVVVIDVPPSVNHSYRVVNGKIKATPEMADYKKRMRYHLLHQKNVNHIDGDVEFSAKIYRRVASGDIDNYLKAILDGLSGNCYADDKQVKRIGMVELLDDPKFPRVEVILTKIMCTTPSLA